MRKFKYILPIIQFLTAMILVFLLFKGNLLPDKYVAYTSITILLLSALTFGLVALRSKITKVISIILSLIMILTNSFGLYSMIKSNIFINSITNIDCQIDNMIVSVLNDNSAQSIHDTIDYVFGYQNITDVENTQTMTQEIETQLGQAITLVEYGSIIDLADALLSGDIEAAIYNEAFDVIIDDEVAGYLDSVKIIYRHEIIVEVETTPTPTPSEQNEDIISTSEVDNCFTLYLSGIDITGDLSKKSRSDVNLIMTVNTDTKKILLTTTPRDTYVYIPGVSGDTKDKLTHAGLHGPETSMATLEQFYGIDIDYYARVNFTSFENIVDILGGIDVESDFSFESRGYSFTEGTNHLNGAAALVFARDRYSFTSGDNQRGLNHQAIIEGIIDKLIEPSTLLNFNALLDSISDNVQINIPADVISDLVKMQIEDGANWEIETMNLTGTGASEYCYSLGSKKYVMIADENSKAEIVSAMEAIIAGE